MSIGELITAVRIALAGGAPEDCPSADRDGAGVSINELIQAVRSALDGCIG